MSTLIIVLVVVSFIVALGVISEGIARYIVNKRDENKDE